MREELEEVRKERKWFFLCHCAAPSSLFILYFLLLRGSTSCMHALQYQKAFVMLNCIFSYTLCKYPLITEE